MEQEERQFIEYLRRTGQKVTRARRKVLEEVFRRHDHFDAEALYLRLKGRQAGVSRATVYRTLSLLDQSGLVHKMELGEARSRYEHILGHPHHDHLICVRCGKIEEFHQPRIEAMQRKLCEQCGFEMHSHSLQIYGLCRRCQTEAAGQSNLP